MRGRGPPERVALGREAGSGAGDQVDEALIIPVVRERHIHEIFRAQFRVHVRFVGLEGDLVDLAFAVDDVKKAKKLLE